MLSSSASEWVAVCNGLPQVSLLGSLLFYNYYKRFNEIIIINNKAKLCADTKVNAEIDLYLAHK